MSSTSVPPEVLYSRDRNLKREDVKTLQKWLSEQPHMPPVAEYQIIVFLHTCSYQVDRTKKVIENYFTSRSRHPEVFYTIDQDVLKHIFKYFSCHLLPQKTTEGHGVVLVKLLDDNLDVFNFVHCISASVMSLTLHMHTFGFVSGILVVFDCRGFSFGHLRKINWSAGKHSIDHVQEGPATKYIGIHMLHASPVIATLKVLVKPFLSTEIYNLVQFHSTIDTLYKYVQRDCLPVDYGGEGPASRVLHDRNVEKMLNNYDFFYWHESQKVDESKRVQSEGYSFFGALKRFFYD